MIDRASSESEHLGHPPNTHSIANDSNTTPAPERKPEQALNGQRSIWFFQESEPLLDQLGFLSGQPSLPISQELQGRAPYPVYTIPQQGRFMWKTCLRGGLLSKINQRTYFSTDRFIRELVLSDQLQRSEIPASRVLAFSTVRKGFGVHVEQLIQLEDDVISVCDLLENEQRTPTREQIRFAGDLILRFHQHGFLHGDLNVMNLMLNRQQTERTKAVLVDIDPGSIPPGENRVGNLARLARSYAKVLARGGRSLATGDRFRFLYHATGGNREYLKEALQSCKARLPETEHLR
ncbi:hypothetical protein CBD41_04135 [bacterium TMED181]|nr:hypothetical protein [Planctomycetota bacterium]OUW45316.1 MAG: hypothetical protein CBD41_04135 [bacterium TMED181]